MATMKELYKKAEVLAELDERLDSFIKNNTDELKCYERNLEVEREENPDMSDEDFQYRHRYDFDTIEGYKAKIKACKELKTELCKLLK